MKILKIVSILLLLSSTVFAGGGNRTGTAGAQELLIPVGSKGIALAGSHIANMTGLDAVYYNPAGLSGSDLNTEVMFSRMNSIGNIDMTYGAIAVNLSDFGSLAFTIRSLDFGEIMETTVALPEGTGSTFSPSFVVLGLTYSNFLTDRIRAGVSFNLISETIQRTNATGISLDAGIQYSELANIKGLSMGVVLRNFGPQMSFAGEDLARRATETEGLRGEQLLLIQAEDFELPSQLELGLSYEQDISDQFSATLSGTFQNNNFSNDEFKIGAEFNYDDMIFVRGGYGLSQNRSAIGNDDNLYGPAFGAGFKLKGDLNLSIDYAFRSVRLFDNNQVFGLSIGF
jgi:hypothetical protein